MTGREGHRPWAKFFIQPTVIYIISGTPLINLSRALTITFQALVWSFVSELGHFTEE